MRVCRFHCETRRNVTEWTVHRACVVHGIDVSDSFVEAQDEGVSQEYRRRWKSMQKMSLILVSCSFHGKLTHRMRWQFQPNEDGERSEHAGFKMTPLVTTGDQPLATTPVS